MKLVHIDQLALRELAKAEKKFPEWPEDIVHACAILQEESGELGKACLDFHYGRGTILRVKEEMAHLGAMVYRFGMYLENYKPGEEEWEKRLKTIKEEK